MKILWLTPSDMVCEWLHGSLDYIEGGHDISYCWYDRIGIPPDRGMLDAVAREKPDIILYISQAGGPYLASPSTFLRLRDKAPIVHICLDAYDDGFADLLYAYKERSCFNTTVACDGGASGPVDLTLFHPVDPRPYAEQTSLQSRPITLGTCGGFPYGLRRDVVTHLQRKCGLYIKPREEKYGSYQRYAAFLKACRIVVDIALSAGGPKGEEHLQVRTLKTRAIEVGLAGACLVELRGCALKNYAAEDVDYLTFETPEEAEEQVRYLIKNPVVAAAMAADFQKKVHRNMNPHLFWEQVFSHAGVK